MGRYILGILVFLFCFTSLEAQKKLKKIKDRQEAYQYALEFFKSGNLEIALMLLEKPDLEGEDRPEIYFLKADIYNKQGEKEKEAEIIIEALEKDPINYPAYYFHLAEYYMAKGDYENALTNYESYLRLDKRLAMKEIAIRERDNCRFALQKAIIGAEGEVSLFIKRDYDVYWPALDIEENTVLYTCQPDGIEYIMMYKDTIDIYINFDSLSNHGTQSITADGQMMYFTACGRSDSYGSCDIYVAYRLSDSTWSDPVNLGFPVNTEAWEAQPSISPDGTKLYFASNRGGGKGKSDIWMSRLIRREKNGIQIWSDPEPLYFNTKGDEMAPYIYYDNKTLFFASDGYEGMGGMDIYKVNLDSHSEPQNIGKTVNTHRNEMGFIVDATGKQAYFSSDADGKKKIYKYTLDNSLSCPPVSYIHFMVKNEEGELLLPNKLIVQEVNCADTLAFYDNAFNPEGMIACVTSNQHLFVSVLKSGYMYYSDTLRVGEVIAGRPMYHEIILPEIESGLSLVLKGIYFDIDDYRLKKESEAELAQLLDFLRANPEVEIEISGHTDDTGGEEYNLTLSENRAFEVYKYLFMNRIKKERMTYRGYGKSKPVVLNDSEDNKALNRRTEIEIKSYNIITEDIEE